MTLKFQVNLSLQTVFANLADMQKYVSFHPVITKIDHKDGNNYLVYETLKFGPIPISFTYPVTVSQYKAANKVIFEATVMKITQIKMEFDLIEEVEGITEITETISFKSFLPIKGLMANIFTAQHQQLFKNMSARK